MRSLARIEKATWKTTAQLVVTTMLSCVVAACVEQGLTPSQELWESEEMPLPLVTADGADEGVPQSEHSSCQLSCMSACQCAPAWQTALAQAWLLVSFALSVNPNWLEKLASRADRTLVERVP